MPRWIRLAALVLLFAGVWIATRMSGLDEHLTREGLRAFIEEAGVLGILAFVALFAAGELLHVPGLVFVAVAVLCWGAALGGVLSLVASVVSVSVTFFVVRAIGGQPLAGVRRPFLKKMLARLEAEPVRTVFLLRTVLFMAPPVNVALALSAIRYRDYLVGSALGLVLPVTACSLLFAWFLK